MVGEVCYDYNQKVRFSIISRLNFNVACPSKSFTVYACKDHSKSEAMIVRLTTLSVLSNRKFIIISSKGRSSDR